MANIKSQKKRIRTNAKAEARNKAAKAELRTRIKTATAEGASDDDVRIAIKRIDMAASKGVLHKNAAARKKSRLMARVNATQS